MPKITNKPKTPMKQNKKNSWTLFIPYILAVILLSAAAGAVSIGISPGRVKFDSVLKDGYAERTVTISTGSDEDLLATIKPDPRVAEWVKFEPNETSFVVSKAKPYLLKIIVEPPEDLPTGNYSGAIEVITEGIVGPSGRAGASIKTAVSLTLNLEVSGTQIVKCRSGGFSFNDAEVGFPFEMGATVINDGNVRLTPTIKINVWDQSQEKLIFTRDLAGDTVLPTTQRRTLRAIANNLAEGQYWVDIKIPECDAGFFNTFSVVEKGAIVDKGELADLINLNPKSFTNDTVQVIAKFQNLGPRSVNAFFKGTIRLDDKIVRIITTDEILVPAGEFGDFDIFFTPEVAGRYVLSGRVVYNKKLTFEKGTIINVSQTEEDAIKKKSGWLPLLIYIIIIVTLIFLIKKIREGKKKRPQ